MKVATKRQSYDELMYLAMILITFTTFPLQKYGLGASKGISIFPMLLYSLLNIFSGSIKINKSFRNELIVITAILFSSFIYGTFIYHDLRGFGFASSMWLSYIIIFFSLYIFVQNANEEKFYKFFKSIILSFKISFIFGVLEMIYFYIAHINAISEFIQLFVRDNMYLNNQRVQFNFGEPSESIQIIGLLFPVIYILKKKNYKFSYSDRISFIGLIILSAIFSKSNSFIIGLSIIGFIFFLNKQKSKKTIIFLGGGILLISIYILTIYSNDIYTYANANEIRLLKLMSSPEESLSGDFSSATRLGLWILAIDVFTHNPFFGCGYGYFGYNFNTYIENLDPIFMTEEMIGKIGNIQQQTYSIFSSILCEAGIIGAIWLLIFLKRINFRNQINQLYIPILLLILIQNMYIYMPLLCTTYFILTNSKVQKYIE